MHEARCELVIRDEVSVVWLALRDAADGVVELQLTGEASREDAPRPATPGPLAELVGWIRERLDKTEREANAALLARAEAFATEDERIDRAQRIGPLLKLQIACAAPPSAARVSAWIDQLAQWSHPLT